MPGVFSKQEIENRLVPIFIEGRGCQLPHITCGSRVLGGGLPEEKVEIKLEPPYSFSGIDTYRVIVTREIKEEADYTAVSLTQVAIERVNGFSFIIYL